MDPITAIFNFLSTPVGQQVAGQLVTAESAFAGLIGDFIKLVHKKNVPPVS